MIEQQAVCAINGTVAQLECLVEAYPRGVTYWKGPGNVLIKNSDKYRMETIETSGYKVTSLYTSIYRFPFLHLPSQTL